MNLLSMNVSIKNLEQLFTIDCNANDCRFLQAAKNIFIIFFLVPLGGCKPNEVSTNETINDSNVSAFVKNNYYAESVRFNVPIKITISATPLNSFGEFGWTKAFPSGLPAPLSHIIFDCKYVNTKLRSMKAGDTAIFESDTFTVKGINSGHQYQIDTINCTIR